MDINALIEHLTDQRNKHGNIEVMVVVGTQGYDIHGLEYNEPDNDLMVVADD